VKAIILSLLFMHIRVVSLQQQYAVWTIYISMYAYPWEISYFPLHTKIKNDDHLDSNVTHFNMFMNAQQKGSFLGLFSRCFLVDHSILFSMIMFHVLFGQFSCSCEEVS